MVKKALLVGINYIGSNYELGGCLNDAYNLYRFITQKCNFPKDKIAGLIERKATKRNIIAGFKWLINNAKAGDELFFSYSGHGASRYDTNNDEVDKYDETLVPIDFKYAGQVLDDELFDIIAQIPEGVKLFCIIDSCHSGSIFDLGFTCTEVTKDPKSGTLYTSVIRDNILKSEKIKAQVVCISGCKDSQTSADTFEDGMQRGAMTWAFERVMRSFNYPNESITLAEVLYQMQTLLKSNHYTQIPNLSTTKSFDSNEKFQL
jgi:hypothetical protein